MNNLYSTGLYKKNNLEVFFPSYNPFPSIISISDLEKIKYEKEIYIYEYKEDNININSMKFEIEKNENEYFYNIIRFKDNNPLYLGNDIIVLKKGMIPCKVKDLKKGDILIKLNEEIIEEHVIDSIDIDQDNECTLSLIFENKENKSYILYLIDEFFCMAC